MKKKDRKKKEIKKETKKEDNKEINRDEILGNQEEEEKIYSTMSQQLIVFQIENKLRESCKTIMEPVVEQQEKISHLIQNINTHISSMKSDIESNNSMIKDLQSDMKHQHSFNLQVKK